MKRVAIPIGVFLAGILITLTAVWLAARYAPARLLALAGVATPAPQTSAPPLNPRDQHRLDFQNQFGIVLTDLEQSQGFELDHYGLSDLIVINQNTIALLNTLALKADRPELRTYASQLKADREAEVSQLFARQKTWGHSHH